LVFIHLSESGMPAKPVYFLMFVHFVTAESYELLRVYPNPFNPSTQIEYSLEQAGTVRLEVFDLQGRLVESLVNTQQQSGTHRIQWLASSQSTGLYFVRIQFENSQSYWYDTHKVTLIK